MTPLTISAARTLFFLPNIVFERGEANRDCFTSTYMLNLRNYGLVEEEKPLQAFSFDTDWFAYNNFFFLFPVKRRSAGFPSAFLLFPLRWMTKLWRGNSLFTVAVFKNRLFLKRYFRRCSRNQKRYFLLSWRFWEEKKINVPSDDSQVVTRTEYFFS